MDGKLKVKKYSEQHYSTIFNKETGLFIRAEETGYPEPFWAKSGPELLDISITNFCNEGCSFCYRASSSKGNHISFNNYKKIITQAQEIGVLQVALGGGNPNEHPRFIDILKLTRELDIIPSYTTNGQNLTEDILIATKKYCGAVAVSAYEPYQYLEKVVANLYNHKIKTNIHFLLTNDTIPRAISWLKRPPIFFKYINAVIFLNYKPINSNADLLLRKSDDLEKLFNLVAEHSRGFKIGFDSCSISGIVENLDVNEMFYESCEAGRFSAFISEEMKMYPCSFMINTDLYGDLNKSSMLDIWQNHKVFKSYRNKILNNRCKNKCIKEQECKGGCIFIPQINLCSKYIDR